MQIFSQFSKPIVSVADFGYIDPTGTNESTAAIASAFAAGVSSNFAVAFPPGVFLTRLQPLYSNLHVIGAGMGVTRLKLMNAQNTDLLSANTSFINMFGGFGTGNVGGITNWSIRDITLDANKANQTGGPSWPLRVYGYAFLLQNVEFCNGFFGGCQLDWNGGDIQTGQEVEAFIRGCRFYDNFGFGLQMGGPHDSVISDFYSMHAANACIHIAPNAAGVNMSNGHMWGIQQANHAPILLIEGGKATMHNVVAESSDTVNVAILGSDCIWDGYIYGSGASPGVGLQLGQVAGQTQFPGQVFASGGLTTAKTSVRNTIYGKFALNTGGDVNFANENNNLIVASLASTTPIVGTPDGSTIIDTGTLSGGGQSATAIVIATGGTISIATPISRINPAGAVTGLIMPAGSIPGQKVTIINESANSATFAASGTSRVAGGVGVVIAAATKLILVWDSGTSLWY